MEINKENWLKEHKNLLIKLGKLKDERKELNKQIKEAIIKLNNLDNFLLKE